MHIEEIILDGFKSYATRTVIGGWDPQFNAITGLNGSGKSNILDAICFVLGISTLSHVRATNLTDLVYKRGQAGVTKATVSIVFDNADKRNSPVGYEDKDKITVTRQLVVGGTNKYLVNGVKRTAVDVASMFHSVQLNINNPHFIIMQGKITKVLNMKPAEILAMVEEAAGTRMFEDRKEKAVKVMGKKDSKMDEIQNLLQTEIQPKLALLRDKRRDYLEFQKLESEMSQIGNFLTAHEYWACEKKVLEFDQEYDALKTEVVSFEAQDRELRQENAHVENMIQALVANKQNVDGEYHRLELEVKELSKEFVKVKTQLDLKASALEEETNGLTQLHQSRLECTNTLAAFADSVATAEASFRKLKAAFETRTKDLEKKQDLLQTLTTGVSSVQGHENGYMDQLQEARNGLSTALSTAQQSRIKISHLKEELKVKAPKAKKAAEQNSSLIHSLKVKKEEISALEAQVEKLVEPDILEMLAQRDAQLDKVSGLKRQIQRIEKDISAYLFHYSNPSKSFDPADVRGIIAELIQIPEKYLESVTALETCAGGRLFNVVVATETVGSQLLDPSKTKLNKRVTLIPLNKIANNPIDPNRIRSAKEIAPGKVELAIDLLDFEKDLLSAIKFVFGTTLICKDSNSAKNVTFDKNVRMRSVTIDGDVYDPSGSLSGGSRNTSSTTLLKFQDYAKLRLTLKREDELLEEIVAKVRVAEGKASERGKVKGALELAVHECGLLEAQIASNSNSQVIFQVDKIEKTVVEESARIEESEEAAEALKKRCKDLENDMKRFTSHKEETLELLKKEIKAEKKAISEEGKGMQAEELKVQTVLQEKAQLEDDIQKFDSNEESIKTAIASIKSELNDMKRRHAELEVRKVPICRFGCHLMIPVTFRPYSQEIIKVREDKLAIERKAVLSHDGEMQGYEKTLKNNKKKLAEVEIALMQVRAQLEKGAADHSRAESTLQELSANPENAWIADHKAHFGVAGGRYDFSKQNVPELRKRETQLAEQHKKSSRNLDRSAMDQFDRIEKKEAALVQKISTVIKDKSKIEETIDSLEKYKIEKLLKTWETVSRDFGLIFSDLLPGNSAKLTPADGRDISSGLEVQVCLGGVWKENLTELSGGQRSLVALSLILALLQFKPAPMYILDEVDSALDESHTQNIGQLLRTRFKEAQFILVSLKDGMYTNANVLFRTKFRDGVSTIERFSQSGAAGKGKRG
ncbi:condensin subunit [Chytriomyces sp. MP71]|nr:condensin subunit [Chytriomyces sp. MP71]